MDMLFLQLDKMHRGAFGYSVVDQESTEKHSWEALTEDGKVLAIYRDRTGFELVYGKKSFNIGKGPRPHATTKRATELLDSCKFFLPGYDMLYGAYDGEALICIAFRKYIPRQYSNQWIVLTKEGQPAPAIFSQLPPSMGEFWRLVELGGLVNVTPLLVRSSARVTQAFTGTQSLMSINDTVFATPDSSPPPGFVSGISMEAGLRSLVMRYRL
jgi:hypothetical protein